MSLLTSAGIQPNRVLIDARGRVSNKGVEVSAFQSSTANNGGFLLSTNTINLTSDNPSAVLYFRSNETSDIVIDSIEIRCGPSTGGTSTQVNRTDYVGVSGGTILDQADAAPFNLRTSGAVAFDGTAKIGGEGITVSGIAAGNIFHLTSEPEVLPSGFIVTKGEDLCIELTPPPGNTSMDVVIRVKFYLLEKI